uniref:22K n=1 Tax=Bat mastadenovirus TaxID=740971 RepID=A0A894JHZ1_9ADEN|nr:22K [Bat mastadenovirus]
MSAQQMEDPEILSTEEISGSEAEEEQEDLESPPESMQEQEQLQDETESPAHRAPRWDQKKRPPGKQPRSYKSWRAHKFKILNSLAASNGSVAFTRRFMLFREGVNLPNNIIHYYNSRYHSTPEHPRALYSVQAQEGCWQDSVRRGGRQPPNPPAPQPHLPHPVRHIPAKQRLPHRL